MAGDLVSKQVRKAVMTALDGATAAGPRVDEAPRMVVFDRRDLPAIEVTSGDDSIDAQPQGRGGQLLRQSLRVNITASEDGESGEVQDRLDDRAREIHDAIYAAGRRAMTESR